MKCMILKPSQSTILEVIFLIERAQHIINIMDLVIQVLEPCIAEIVMPILCNIELMKLIQNSPFKW